MIQQTIFPFKLGLTSEKLTARGGLDKHLLKMKEFKLVKVLRPEVFMSALKRGTL